MSTYGPYSSYQVANGLVYTAGQIGATKGKTAPDITAQTNQAIRNLAAVLKSAGSGLDKVIKTTVYLTHMDHFEAMNKAYAAAFAEAGTAPARTTVGVQELPRVANVPLLIELEAVAALTEPL